MMLMARFHSALQARCAALALPYTVGFSYGLVCYEPIKHSSVEDMLHEADSAMYANKRDKSGCP
ncbi:hypothetical protein B0E46_06575 [Rhodanobacter sp. B04]|nr:hypothetical protein B0E46_06575 [Rhodanobacter sp. B04]